jgi:hypothetical protein
MVEVPCGMDDFYEAHHATLDDPDYQVMIGIKRNRAASAFHVGNYEQSLAHALSFDRYSPIRLDLFWGCLAALQIGNREGLAGLHELSLANEFRGRHQTALHRMIEGGIAALDGHLDAAATAFGEVWDLAQEIYPPAVHMLLYPPIAALLGWDHPLGYEAGRRAYDLLASIDSEHLTGRYASGAIPPDVPASSAG